MILEVTGTGTRNKGAELLLVAIARQLAVPLAVMPNFGPYEARAKYGLLQKVRIDRWGRSKIAMGMLPSSFRKTYGMVTEEDIGGIIDAAGFAFGDQLPVERARAFAADCVRWKSQGKPIVLLPQALGPFEKEDSRSAFRDIAGHADLLFARDTDSLRYAKEAAPGQADKILIAPDITIGLEGVAPAENLAGDNVALLVPNIRMLDRTSLVDAKAYVPFLAQCARLCREAGLEPQLLIHDAGEDEKLIDPLRAELGEELPAIREADPLRLKGILKQARLVIGSRFHALVGALSGGVPAIAAGWSHKYQRLFEDFQCPEMVVGIDTEVGDLRQRIEQLVTERDERSAKLQTVTGTLRDQLGGVWNRVEEVLR